ncbi:hypothetical protein [Vibrio parahaemolyticus]|uniref:hypothetical protein n=1 Tax=Vibrio parahaemolyticus TaxID=670 RepID=UPI000AD5D0BA|nr:hypothetical protein [Vibrio parahaemolyticus]
MEREEDKTIDLTEPSCEKLGIARFLASLEKDIEQHTDKLVFPSHEMKDELGEVVGDC